MSTIQTEQLVALGPEWNGAAMTPAEFDAVKECDDRYVYELVHGVVIVTPPPLEAERDPNDELGYLLRDYRERHLKGTTLDGTLPEQLVRAGRNRRRADRVIWAGLGRTPDPRTDVPTIVIAFVSAGRRSRRRDYEEKRREYHRIGVAEYWVIDRFRRILTVYHADGTERVITERENYASPRLPGFKLPLARLLRASDRWA